jgi:glycine cleavage system aminomethyltransferase T
MESRQKLAKRLVGLRFDEPLTVPAALWVDDHEVGVVTSVAHSPGLGWIGLGYLKSTGGAEGQMVQSRSDNRTLPATVSALPLR